MSSGYEFTPAQNTVFQRLVTNMWRAGITVVVGALVFLVFHGADYFGVSLTTSPQSHVLININYGVWVLLGIIGGVTGVLLIRATTGFRALIATEGNDIEHLMGGLVRLAGILGVVFWSAVLAVLLLGFSLVLLLVS